MQMKYKSSNVRCRRGSRSSRWLVGYAAMLALFAGPGCNSQPSGEIVSTVSASGVLTYKGQPLENHRVTLIAEGKRPASGVSDAEGHFVLGTNDLSDGAPAGEHRVSVAYVGPPDADPEAGALPPPKVKIPAKYTQAEKSGLTVTVPPGGSSELSIELK